MAVSALISKGGLTPQLQEMWPLPSLLREGRLFLLWLRRAWGHPMGLALHQGLCKQAEGTTGKLSAGIG